ncbi:hypothetical protein PRK78_003851 [Emydomyces testavorans]|uniref:Uncharacterized protein n=1 Tax=Emydomyces testavorans TaxID=2070801 RepID=A0AAF0DHK0_9EURO|nr:hypothetical protein PRK78_003851 [Emydomyces testavorans]
MTTSQSGDIDVEGITGTNLEKFPPEPSSSEKSGNPRFRIFVIIITSIIAVLALSVIISKSLEENTRDSSSSYFRSAFSSPNSFISSGQPSNPKFPVTTCGRTRSEALSRNCTFDVLASAWIPPLCYDAQLVRLSQSENTTLASLGGSGPFPWWLDDNHTVSVAQDKLSSLDSMVAYTWETFHVAHCLYKWQWLLKATERMRKGEKGVWVHDQVITPGHIRHCNEIIANQGMRVGAKAEVQFAFGKCARLDPIE